MLVFRLRSNSDDQRSNPSNESQPTNASNLFSLKWLRMTQNDSEWPTSHDLQLFQSFLTEVAQNDSERPISPDLQLFQSFPTEVAQNDLEWPILPDLQLF